MSWFDGIIYKFPLLRKTLNILIPDRATTISLLHRNLTISTRSEVGLLRLAWLINSSPTGHEIASLFSLAGFIRPGDTFVDVGANIGLYSVLMASLGEMIGFSVVAIEPNARTAEVLRKNLSSYECATVIEGAASNFEGKLTFAAGLASGTFHVAQKNSTNNKFYSVRAFRLDQLETLSNTRLVLKIDVEGHEAEVLEGLQGALEFGRVSVLMIDGFKDKKIPDKLASLGFKLFDGRSLQQYNGHFNLLAVRDSEADKRNDRVSSCGVK